MPATECILGEKATTTSGVAFATRLFRSRIACRKALGTDVLSILETISIKTIAISKTGLTLSKTRRKNSFQKRTARNQRVKRRVAVSTMTVIWVMMASRISFPVPLGSQHQYRMPRWGMVQACQRRRACIRRTRGGYRIWRWMLIA